MVWIFLSCALATGVLQERVALPSTRTVQAPQRPSPQPYLQPVRSRSSRRTLSRVRSASASRSRRAPLTCRCLTVAMKGSPRRGGDGDKAPEGAGRVGGQRRLYEGGNES